MNDGMRANSTVDDGQWRMGWEMNDASTSELTFEAGGAPAEAQGGGIIQNAIPKEGGNTFSGTWFTYYGTRALASENAGEELRDLLGEPNSLDYDYDTNPAFGGRIIRDRLWFFTSMRADDRKERRAGTYFAAPGEPCIPEAIDCIGRQEALDWFGAEAGEQAYYRRYGVSGLVRFTNQFTDRHKWRLGFERLNRRHPSISTDSTRPIESSNHTFQPIGYHAQVRWTSSISNRLLIEAGTSVQYNKWRHEQFPWNYTRPASYDVSTGTWGGGFWIGGWQPERSRYIKTSMSYVTGSHNFKAGVEHRWGNISLEQWDNGIDVRSYFYDNGDPIGVMVLATPLGRGLGQPGHYAGGIDFDTGVFAQDSWTVDKWTLNLGVRGDFFSSGVPPQYAPAGTWVPERTLPAYPGPRWNTVVGRFGVAYDVFGDGRTAIKGTAHHYISQESTRLAMMRNPLSTYTWSAAQEFRSWDDLDGSGGIVGPDGRVQYEEVGESPNVNFGTANDVRNLALDDREGHWEYNAQIQHEIFPGISTTFGWYRRNYFKMWWEDNDLRTFDDWTPFHVNAPVDDRLGQWSGQSLELYNLNEDVYGDVSRTITHVRCQRPPLRRFRVRGRRPAAERGVLRRQLHARSGRSSTSAIPRPRPARPSTSDDQLPDPVVRLAAGVADACTRPTGPTRCRAGSSSARSCRGTRGRTSTRTGTCRRCRTRTATSPATAPSSREASESRSTCCRTRSCSFRSSGRWTCGVMRRFNFGNTTDRAGHGPVQPVQREHDDPASTPPSAATGRRDPGPHHAGPLHADRPRAGVVA